MQKNSVERTRAHLERSLARDIALYKKYVPDAKVLCEYLEVTKKALLLVVEDVFDEKIRELGTQAADKRSFANVLYLVKGKNEP